MEFVYVVKREELFPMETPYGLVTMDINPALEFFELICARGFFVERDYAEQTASLKQIIVYSVMHHGDMIFAMRRLDKCGESRLHNRTSIGVGGHINPEDAVERDDLIHVAMAREIDEEVRCGDSTSRFIGIINDDRTPVGAVHLGVVFSTRLHMKMIEMKEKDLMEGELVSIDDLKSEKWCPKEKLETWSSILLNRSEDWID